MHSAGANALSPAGTGMGKHSTRSRSVRGGKRPPGQQFRPADPSSGTREERNKWFLNVLLVETHKCAKSSAEIIRMFIQQSFLKPISFNTNSKYSIIYLKLIVLQQNN